MKKVVWKPIAGYEGLYSISSNGEIRSENRTVKHSLYGQMRIKEKIIKPWKGNKCGHLYVSLSDNTQIQKKLLVHRLVLETFVGPCPQGMECCHFPDRNVTNNQLENLRWDTSKSNTEDMKKHGISCRAKSYNHVPKGENHPHAKLTDKQIKIILQEKAKGERGTGRRLAKRFGVSESTICDIYKGRIRNKG